MHVFIKEENFYFAMQLELRMIYWLFAPQNYCTSHLLLSPSPNLDFSVRHSEQLASMRKIASFVAMGKIIAFLD